MEKPFGFCKEVTVDYYKDCGMGGGTMIYIPGEPLEVRGETWKEALLNAVNDMRPKDLPFELKQTCTISMKLFDTAEEWDDYAHKFKEYHGADKEDQEFMHLSEPDGVNHLFIKNN